MINNEQVSFDEIRKAIKEADKMYKYKEGRIIIQLMPDNHRLLVSHHYGDSWESMGLNARESENRIITSWECEGRKMNDEERESLYEELTDKLQTTI